MKKLCLVFVLVLVPSVVWAQGAVTIAHMSGPVEIRPASKVTFVHLTDSVRQVQVGDQIQTGDGGTITLTLPDRSYMVVTPNSKVTVQDSWSFEKHNIANVLLGKVWFYIQNLAGKPNPISVQTPTALIAVRGTKFLVAVDDAQWTEVRCDEGHVVVESGDREVVLEPGKKTLVRRGDAPLKPVNQDVVFPPRSFQVVQKDPADANKNPKGGISLPDGFGRDNDRGNRPAGLSTPPSSTTDPTVLRGKPTLSFP